MPEPKRAREEEQPEERENGREDGTEAVMETASGEAKDAGHQVKEKIEIEVSVLKPSAVEYSDRGIPSHSHPSAATSAASSWTTQASSSSWGTLRML